MNAAEFDTQFNRLTSHFHLPTDASRETIGMDWFKALEHYHIDALEHAVSELIKTETSRFWPPLGKVTELIRTRIGRYDKTPGKCATCNGSSWIEAQPWKSNGMIYEGLQRCPDCGIPAPQGHERHAVRGLTSLEFHAHQQGEKPSYMPIGLEAKHPEKPGNPELKAAMDQLRKKLFGAVGDVA